VVAEVVEIEKVAAVEATVVVVEAIPHNTIPRDLTRGVQCVIRVSVKILRKVGVIFW
jgi:hypothetical protein